MQYQSGLLFSLCKNLTFYTFTQFSMLHMDVYKEMMILLSFLIKVIYIKESAKKSLLLHNITKNILSCHVYLSLFSVAVYFNEILHIYI